MSPFDLQKMVDTWSKLSRETRSQYHVTLGKLLDVLEAQPAEKRFALAMPQADSHLVHPHSYRGYYSDLAFEFDLGTSTVGEMLPVVRDCLDREFMGYKGGEYFMDRDTPLWISS